MIPVLANVRRYSAVTSPPPRLLTLVEVAEYLGLSTHSVRRYVRLGELRAIRFTAGGRLRFRQDDVEAFCSRNIGAPA